MRYGDDALKDLVSHVVTNFLDVLCVLTKCGVACNKGGNLVFTIDRHRCWRDNTQLLNIRRKLITFKLMQSYPAFNIFIPISVIINTFYHGLND